MNITRYHISKDESFCIKFKTWNYNRHSSITSTKLGRQLFFPKNPGCLSISGEPKELVEEGIRVLCFEDWSKPLSNISFPLMNLFRFIDNKKKR